MFKKLVAWPVIIFFICLVFVPLLWVLVSSFKSNIEFFSNPLGLPRVCSLDNYIMAFSLEPFMTYLINSIMVALISTILAIIISLLAAYVFIYQFCFKKLFYIFYISGLFVPLSAFMLPYFMIVNWLGLYDTIWGLSLIYMGVSIPLSFLIIHTHLREIISTDIIEAAYIDGASFHQIFHYLVAPLSKTGLITSAIFLLITAWNELLYALLLTQSANSRTIQVAIRFFVSSFAANYPLAFAAIIIAILSMILIYIFFTNRIISGLTFVSK